MWLYKTPEAKESILVKQKLELILTWYFKDLEVDDLLEFNLKCLAYWEHSCCTHHCTAAWHDCDQGKQTLRDGLNSITHIAWDKRKHGKTLQQIVWDDFRWQQQRSQSDDSNEGLKCLFYFWAQSQLWLRAFSLGTQQAGLQPPSHRGFECWISEESPGLQLVQGPVL